MITTEGSDEIRANIRALAKKYPKAMAAAVYKLGVAILSNSIPRVPVEFGRLRASGYVSPPQGEGLQADVELGYGTDYAIPQHERLDYRHPRGGEAKYLEKAVYAVAPRSLELLQKWTIELVGNNAQWGSGPALPQLTFPSRPKVSASVKPKRSQVARMARSARNVRRRLGR